MLTIEEDKLKILLQTKKNKIERPKFSGTGEIISAISIMITLLLADFNQVSFINPLYFQFIVWIIAFAILAFGLYVFVKSLVSFYSIDNLYNEIVNLDPNIEHPFNIILIKNSKVSGKYLLFKSKRWKCWLFPNYHCLNGSFNLAAEMEHIRECLKRDVNTSGNIDLEYLGNEISYKYSVSDKIDKKYNFHYFQIINIELHSRKKWCFRFNGKRYCWKTLAQMYSDKNIVKKNEDVLDYVRKTCDMS